MHACFLIKRHRFAGKTSSCTANANVHNWVLLFASSTGASCTAATAIATSVMSAGKMNMMVVSGGDDVFEVVGVDCDGGLA